MLPAPERGLDGDGDDGQLPLSVELAQAGQGRLTTICAVTTNGASWSDSRLDGAPVWLVEAVSIGRSEAKANVKRPF